MTELSALSANPAICYINGMKIMKSYRQLIPVVGIPILAISAIILYFTNTAVQLFKIHWLALAAVLVFAVGPWGRQRLTTAAGETPRYSLWHWLGRIAALQLCLGAVFLGISAVCGQTAPTTPPALLQYSLTQLLVAEGLFPWAFFTMAAVAMGYHSYCRRENSYLATTLNPLISNPAAMVVINFIGKLATFVAYSVTFCLVASLWANVGTTPGIVTGFSLTPILVATILLIISFTKIYRRNLTRSLGQEVPLIPGLFLWVICLAAGIWLLNGFLAPLTQTPLTPPSLLNHWLQQPWRDLWMIFANSWWLLWIPLIGITIARISRGYRLRELIAATLGLPLICSLALGFTRHWRWDIAPTTAAVITGAGLFGLLLFTLHKKALPSFILVYLPKADHYKFRSYRRALVKIAQAAVAFLFIYLPGGLPLIHFLVFAAAWPLVVIVLLSYIAGYKRL